VLQRNGYAITDEEGRVFVRVQPPEEEEASDEDEEDLEVAVQSGER